MGIRVYGIDIPEIRDEKTKKNATARSAKQFAVEKLRPGKVIMLKNMRRGKYFHIVAEVWSDRKSLADMLTKASQFPNLRQKEKVNHFLPLTIPAKNSINF